MKTLTLSALLMLSVGVTAGEQSIHWLAWSQAAFDTARELDKPMLVNVGHASGQ